MQLQMEFWKFQPLVQMAKFWLSNLKTEDETHRARAIPVKRQLEEIQCQKLTFMQQ